VNRVDRKTSFTSRDRTSTALSARRQKYSWRMHKFSFVHCHELQGCRPAAGAADTACSRVTFATANNRQDPLFTMSDNTPASQRETRRIRIRYFMDGFFGLQNGNCKTLSAVAFGWWSQSGLNRRPHACKARALPAELWPQANCGARNSDAERLIMVGLGRLELPTSRLSSARSNQLSYKPEKWS
jgi:hypothetical protein